MGKTKKAITMPTTLESDKHVTATAAKAISNYIRFNTSLPLNGGRVRKCASGWYRIITDKTDDCPAIVIYYDKFRDGTSMVFWVGFEAETQEEMDEFVRRSRYPAAALRVFTNDDTATAGNNAFDHLKVRLEDGRPVRENFDETDDCEAGYYLGLYSDTGKPLNIYKTEGFLKEMLAHIGMVETGDSGVWEGTRQMRSHMIAERNATIAKQRKVKDRYTCQACFRTMMDSYGELGRGYAEVHHLKPLAALEGPVLTRLEDLCTLCPNCHRMIHQLNGEAGDLEMLRGIVRPAKAS